MSIARCPRCRDEVTVPSHVSAEALVECPWCRERYPLAEAIESMPPLLRVVGVSSGVMTMPNESPEAELRLLPEEPARPIVVTERPRTDRAVSRVRRPARSKSLMVEMVKIVAGGIVGLSIGQLILWWMPGKWAASQRDPLGLAAKVSRWAPFVVPAHLRSGSLPLPAAVFPDASQESPAKESSGRSRSPTTARGAVVPADRGGQLSDDEDPFRPRAPSPKSGQNGGAESGTESPASRTSAPEQPQRAGQIPPPGGATPGRPNQPTTPDARAVYDLVLAAQFASQQAEPSERFSVLIPFLLQIAQDLPWLVVHSELDAELSRQLESWLTGLTPDRDAWEELSRHVQSQLEMRSGQSGQILFGVVREIKESGEWQEISLQTSPSSPPILVLIPPQLPVAVLSGDVVMVLGAGLSDAGAQLPEYPGQATRATLAGWLCTLRRSDRDEVAPPPSSRS